MTFDRKTGIGATDARLIMEGSWHPLWLEKTGRAAPPDLSDVFRVQLGKQTESFHAEWMAKRQKISWRIWEHGDPMARRFDVANQWRYVTLDGWDLTNDKPIEVKHSHSQMQIRHAADFYMPQIQHNLAVTQADWLWFSVIPGNDEPMTVQVQRNYEYIARLTELERQFWWHVTENVAPDIIPSAEIERVNALTDQVLVGGFTAPQDMSRHNEWATLAAEFIELKPKADRCAEVNKELKALVEPHWGGAFGHGVKVARTKKGLTLTIEKGASDGSSLESA